MPRDEPTVRRSEPAADPIDWPAELARHGRWLRTVALRGWAKRRRPTMCCRKWRRRPSKKATSFAIRRSVGSVGCIGWRSWRRLQYRRRQGRRRKLIDRYADRQPPPTATAREPDPLDWLLADERKAMVRQALASCRGATPKSCC